MSEKTIQGLKQVVEAVRALAPNYNRLTQLVLLSQTADWETLLASFPEFGDKQLFEEMQQLGLRVDGNKIVLSGLLNWLHNSIVSAMNEFSLPQMQGACQDLIGEKVPDFRKEWILQKVRATQNVKVRKILLTLTAGPNNAKKLSCGNSEAEVQRDLLELERLGLVQRRYDNWNLSQELEPYKELVAQEV